jgi:hypothetical protein
VNGRHWDAEADGLLEARLASLAAVTTLKQLQFRRCKTMGACYAVYTGLCTVGSLVPVTCSKRFQKSTCIVVMHMLEPYFALLSIYIHHTWSAMS